MVDPQELDNLDQSISSLIPQAVDGNRTAQSELFVQLQNYFLLMANHQLEPELRARINPSDIVQESLAKATQALPNFRGTTGGEVRAWLKAIVGNEIKEQRRKHHQQKRDLKRETKIPTNNESRNLGVEPVANAPTPESELIAAEEIAKLKSVLAKLSDDHRQVIELRSLQRLKFEQVAKKMGRSVEAVSKLWYRAIIELRKHIQ